jgi:chaperonin cofactor prefoldin
MTFMHAEIYDALRSIPGMDDAKARRAAEAVGTASARTDRQEERADRLEKKLDRLETDVQTLKTDMHLVKWMVGVGIVLSLGILGKLLVI